MMPKVIKSSNPNPGFGGSQPLYGLCVIKNRSRYKRKLQSQILPVPLSRILLMLVFPWGKDRAKREAAAKSVRDGR